MCMNLSRQVLWSLLWERRREEGERRGRRERDGCEWSAYLIPAFYISFSPLSLSLSPSFFSLSLSLSPSLLSLPLPPSLPPSLLHLSYLHCDTIFSLNSTLAGRLNVSLENRNIGVDGYWDRSLSSNRSNTTDPPILLMSTRAIEAGISPVLSERCVCAWVRVCVWMWEREKRKVS